MNDGVLLSDLAFKGEELLFVVILLHDFGALQLRYLFVELLDILVEFELGGVALVDRV